MATIKSIKEKAEEYDRILKRISPNESIVDIYGRKQFEEGANYVLDEIEKIINHPRRFVTGDKTVEEGMIEEILKLVEHLKKK